MVIGSHLNAEKKLAKYLTLWLNDKLIFKCG
jgi:hypothetical protein